MAHKKTPNLPDQLDVLRQLIADYVECARADEIKGGGDPLAIPEIEAELNLARTKLEIHIAKLARDEET